MKPGIRLTFFGRTLDCGATAAAPPPFLLLSHTAPAVLLRAVMNAVGALPAPIAIWSTVRPAAPDLGVRAVRGESLPSSAASSRCVSRRQFARLPSPPRRVA